jgi:hypothetical protein
LDYLKQYQPNVPLVALNGGSSISSESLKGLLVKDKELWLWKQKHYDD